MAIQYRNVDADDIQTQVLTGRALDGERQAFAAEMEVTRLTALAASAKTKEEKDAVVLAQREAEASAATLRAKATRVKGNVTLDPEAVADVRAGFLNDWVTSLEQEHVAHAALLQQRQASLAMTGAGAPTDDEKKEIQERLKQNEEALKVIESSWNVATKNLDSTTPAPAPAPVDPAPVAPAPTPVQAAAQEIKPSPNNAAPTE